MKFIVFSFILLANLLMAMPTNEEVNSAIKERNYPKAETMIREVISAKPQSAKAHYYLAQVLAHESKFMEAKNELTEAKRIDSSLKFGDATKISEFEKKLEFALNKSTTASSSKQIAQSPNIPWGLIILGIGVLVIILIVIFKNKSRQQSSSQAYSNPNPNAPNISPNPQPFAQPQQSSGIGSTIMGGLAAGAAAAVGMSVVDSLLHHNEAHADNNMMPPMQNNTSNENPFTNNSNDFDM
ncbi:MAG: hypothetical protein HY307_01780, partial [Arcobacter sp.]|nr:hypothetical protein [Arcobacter sp.]